VYNCINGEEGDILPNKATPRAVFNYKGKEHIIVHDKTEQGIKSFYTKEEDLPEELISIVEKTVEEMYEEGGEPDKNSAEYHDIKDDVEE
jgi:hypothetical protein